MRLFVYQARFGDGSPFPGLYDVQAEDGREWRDLTSAQITALGKREGADGLVLVNPGALGVLEVRL